MGIDVRSFDVILVVMVSVRCSVHWVIYRTVECMNTLNCECLKWPLDVFK